MAAKSTHKSSARRKAKTVSLAPTVVANIVFINPEIRKQRAHEDWDTAFKAYIHTLSDDEQALVKKCLAFILAAPKNREYLHGPCPVIPFPVKNKHLPTYKV